MNIFHLIQNSLLCNYEDRTDLQQHINGKISYIPTMHPNTLKSELEKYFDGEES